MTEEQKIMASIFDPSLIEHLDPLTPLDYPYDSWDALIADFSPDSRNRNLGLFPVRLEIIPEPHRTAVDDARTVDERNEVEESLNELLPSHLFITVVEAPDGHGEAKVLIGYTTDERLPSK